VLSLALAGCVNLGSRNETPAVVYYVLKDPAPPAIATPVRADAPTLLVLDTTTGSFYDTDQLIFSRSAGTRGQYSWRAGPNVPASALPISCVRGSITRVPGMSAPPGLCAR